MLPRSKPFVLIILDGWGASEAIDGNAIYAAKKPTWDHLWSTYPHTLLACSGLEVGLPTGQMGNSEVGHLNIGAGRIVYQELTRINKAIEDSSFLKNPVFLQAINNKKPIHVLGLLSPGGIHSHEDHIHAFLTLAQEQGAKELYLHAFLDGRDTPPKSAKNSLGKVKEYVASITGRYYAMDRDKRWERTELAYGLLTQNKAPYQATSPLKALEIAYQRGETDEFVKPTLVGDHPPILPGDTVVFMNFRADRARQLTELLMKSANVTTLTRYSKDWNIPCAFPPSSLNNILGGYLAEKGFKQLRIAETEKYAHVTYFFNGSQEQPFPGEDRVLISSPKVATYDLCPEMSAREVTDKLTDAIQQNGYDFIVCNFANADMVGHSGKFSAAVKAIEVLDECLGKISDAVLKVGGEILITADHGNAEQMHDHSTQQSHTAHTMEPVPLVYVGKQKFQFKSGGKLADVAPTILQLLSLDKPKEMTGQSLIS